MRTFSGQRIAALLLMSLCVPAMAANVQKWVDANGQVHFGDAPPPGSNAQTVSVKAPPPGRNPAPAIVPSAAAAPTPAPFRSIADERQAHIDEVTKQNQQGMAALGAAQARTQALNDKAAVDQCRSARNSGCDRGANAVRQQNYQHELSQQAAQSGAAAAQGRAVPLNQRIQPMASCQWPQTCPKSK